MAVSYRVWSALSDLGEAGGEVGVGAHGEVVNPVADHVVDAERRVVLGGIVDRDSRVSKGQGVLALGIEVGNARVVVAPLVATAALGRNLPVSGIDVRSLLEDRIGRAVVCGWDVVAAIGDLVSLSPTTLGVVCSCDADLLCHARRHDDIFPIWPHNSEGVVGHGTSPCHADPTEADRGNDLECGIEVGLVGDAFGDGHAKRDALFVGVRGPVQTRLGIGHLVRLCLGEGFGKFSQWVVACNQRFSPTHLCPRGTPLRRHQVSSAC